MTLYPQRPPALVGAIFTKFLFTMPPKKHTRSKPDDKNTAAPEVHLLPLALIAPDPNNPRQKQDPEKLQELADSIAKFGIIQPITVRPEADGFIVICGHRRREGALLAGEETIPSIVRTGLSAQDILEMQVLENLQREDIDPMDEAAAFQSLMKKKGIDKLASEIGKPKRYVVNRMQLLQLIPVAKFLVSNGALPVGHAMLIAKLDEGTQRKALETISYGHAFDDPELDDQIDLELFEITDTREDLQNWIKNRFKPLGNAPFPLDDETLYPEAGACSNCNHRTLNQNLLFSDLSDQDECTKSDCYRIKEAKYFEARIAQTKVEHGEIKEADVFHYDHTRARVDGKVVQIMKHETPGSVPLLVTEKAGGGLKPGDVVYYVPEEETHDQESDDKPGNYKVAGGGATTSDNRDDNRELFVAKYMELRGTEEMAKKHFNNALKLFLGTRLRQENPEDIQMIGSLLGVQSELLTDTTRRDFLEKRKFKDELVAEIFEQSTIERVLQAAMALFVCDEIDSWLDGDNDFDEDTPAQPLQFDFELPGFLAAMDIHPLGTHVSSIDELK